MKYKLLCTDMDGTLLNDKKEVSERTIKVIKEAHAKGAKIAICTGRPFTSANVYADLIGIKTPVISANGAYIRDKDNDEIIYQSKLGIDNCKKILSILKKYEIPVNFHGPDIMLCDEFSYSAKIYMKLNESLPEDKRIKVIIVDDWKKALNDNIDSIVKCLAIDNDIKKIKSAKEEMIKEKELETVSSYSNNFEVMCKGVSKGRAVEILSKYLGINQEEIICIGDNENDISMIRYAGLGVAMGNAEKLVKETADYITDTNDKDGVAKVIEKFMLS